jgi:homoserine dehydrogenase
VLGDLVAVARNRIAGGRGPRESAYAALPIQPMGQVLSCYHISLDVDDKAGVLAAVATAFAEAGVSISTVRQEGQGGWGGSGEAATLVVVTHSAPDAALAGTVDKLAELDSVHQVTSVMRVMGDLR